MPGGATGIRPMLDADEPHRQETENPETHPSQVPATAEGTYPKPHGSPPTDRRPDLTRSGSPGRTGRLKPGRGTTQTPEDLPLLHRYAQEKTQVTMYQISEPEISKHLLEPK